MGFIRNIFHAAAEHTVLDRGEKPIIYCDCGNTLFGSRFESGFNVNLFHFLVAAKKAGYDVRLMSDEPRRYTAMIKERLKEMGLRDRFFQDEEGTTITIKEAMQPRSVFIVIDNNHLSHKIRAQRFVNPHDEEFAKDLKMFTNPKKSLPDSLKPENLLERQLG